MPNRSRNREDENQAAFRIVRQATAEAPMVLAEKNPAAVALGRLGGLKGGKARAKGLTKAERSEAARKAALARWGKKLKRKPRSRK